MSALELQINLAGNFASALEKANAGLGGTEKGAKKAAREIELFDNEVDGLKTGLGGLEVNFSALAKGGSLFTFDLAEGLRSAVELVSRLVEGFVDLGKEALGVAGKTQDLNLALELNLGKEKADQVKELAESFERTTRFDASDIKQALLPLLKQGIGDVSVLDDIATIGADMAARTNGGIAAVQQTIDSFAGIFQKGRLKPAGLEAFGIQAQTYFAALATQEHISVAAAEKLAKSGGAQDKLAKLVVQMVARRQGGDIGPGALAGGKTLGGTLDRLSHVKENLFEGLANSPGMAAVNGFLDNFIKTMKGPIGTELIGKLSTAFTSLFGDLSGPEGLKKMEAGVKRFGDKAIEIIDKVVAALPEVLSLFERLPGILNKAVTVAEIFATIWVGGRIVTGITLVASALPAVATGLGVMAGAATAATTSLGATAAMFGVALAPVAAFAAMLGSVYFAYKRISDTRRELGGSFSDDFAQWQGGKVAVAHGNAGFAAMQAENARNLARAHGLSAPELASSDGGMSVPAFADGGIVRGPTLALIGEAGPEAIVPLSESRGSLNDILGSSGLASMSRDIHLGGVVVHVNGDAAGGDGRALGEKIATSFRIELKRFLDELPT